MPVLSSWRAMHSFQIAIFYVLTADVIPAEQKINQFNLGPFLPNSWMKIWVTLVSSNYLTCIYTSLGLLASLGVPFLWSVRLNNSYVRSIQWINTLELEKKSSVTVTFTLFVNAQLTFLPVKYPYCVLCRLLSSIQYPNIEEIYINVSVPFIWSVLSLTNYLNI